MLAVIAAPEPVVFAVPELVRRSEAEADRRAAFKMTFRKTEA
jgi:hypothetical protein